jgi:ATP-dependent DNA helicase DinG
MLELESILPILKPDGSLSRCINGYEPREQQQQMLSNVVDAYNHNKIALIEAGTGTGKSMAYLIPAIIWSLKRGERTLVSTNTIALQEQLIHKDIPLAIKAIGNSIKAVLVKGMGNYLCIRKLHDARYEKAGLPDLEAEELDKIEAWAEKTVDGSVSDLPFNPSYNSWERVSAESDTCNRRQCPHYEECHFIRARRQAEEAQILVTNHNMLFADLAFRSEEHEHGEGLIPDYQRVILDEAHNIEDTATEFFADQITHLQWLRSLRRLSAEKMGKLTLLRTKIDEVFQKKSSPELEKLMMRLAIDLSGKPHEISVLISDSFQVFRDFIDTLHPNEEEEKGNEKFRILPRHYLHPEWDKRIVPHAKKLIEAVRQYTTSIRQFEIDLLAIKHPKLADHTEGIRFEVNALTNRLDQATLVLEEFISHECPKTRVKWIEVQQMKTMTNMHLIDANLDIAKVLAESLFKKFPTTVLCSATLATNKSFSFMKERLGITEGLLSGKLTTENIYTSPFDYQKQAMLVIPNDIPQPNDPQFLEAVCERIWEAVQASRGNAFLLFTSYSMLQTCYDRLSKRMIENRFHLFKQGDANRQTLLNQFKNKEYSILFGTSSFWEGVDVPGDALRCVVIVKLPFKVPSEPLIQARTELIVAEGGDPFYDYSVPLAIVKFKQGFGRLIRNKKDRGCIVCLDSRLITKNYGRLFLNSLPQCQELFAPSNELLEPMKEFYKKTYHMTK